MNRVTADPRIKRIAEAKEVICSCIIFSIHDKYKDEIRTFVIDYITDEFLSLEAVIRHYIMCGNATGKVRGYGTENILKDTDFHNKKILYYNETSSYLWDPVANAPVDTLPSCFQDYEDPTEPLKIMLEDFVEHIISGEPDTSELFVKTDFTSDTIIEERLKTQEHLKNFFDLVDTDYFDKSLF